MYRDIRKIIESEKIVTKQYMLDNNYIEYENDSDKSKTLSVKEYLKQYFKDIINNLKKSDTWKIQLKIAITCISYKNCDEEQVTNSKSHSFWVTSF